jgi:GNAT superfamily N-acetyltransferase
MSGRAPSEAAAQADPESRSVTPSPPTGGGGTHVAPGLARRQASWRVRAAAGDEVPAIAAAVGELLAELGATPPSARAMEAAARVLIHDRHTGAVLVAESEGALIGVLGASWQNAIHVPGRYGLIQDLWVQPSWRGSGVGAGLLAALFELAHERKLARVEVGLPREHFADLAATEAFYVANGFTVLGARMRRSIA